MSRDPWITVGCASGNVVGEIGDADTEGIGGIFAATAGNEDGIEGADTTQGPPAKLEFPKKMQLIANIINERYPLIACPVS